jgi:hypothetical protein
MEVQIGSRKIIIVFLAAILITLTVTAAGIYASYVMKSNSLKGTPTAQATLTLSANSTSPVVGDTLMLIAHVSDNSTGIPITLTNNDVAVGTPIDTDSEGNAVFYVVVTSAYDFVATGTHT